MLKHLYHRRRRFLSGLFGLVRTFEGSHGNLSGGRWRTEGRLVLYIVVTNGLEYRDLKLAVRRRLFVIGEDDCTSWLVGFFLFYIRILGASFGAMPCPPKRSAKQQIALT